MKIEIKLELSEDELDDLLTALCEWSPDNQYRVGENADEDDVRSEANDYCSPRETRMGELYQKFGQFLPVGPEGLGQTLADLTLRVTDEYEHGHSAQPLGEQLQALADDGFLVKSIRPCPHCGATWSAPREDGRCPLDGGRYFDQLVVAIHQLADLVCEQARLVCRRRRSLRHLVQLEQ